MRCKVFLHVPAETASIVALREWIETFAGRCGEAVRIPGLMLAVEEVFNNICLHGYRKQGGDVELEMQHRFNVLIVRIRDRAMPFNPLGAPEPDLTLALDERPVGGLGIHLVKESVDRVRYRPLPDGGNELALLLTLK